MTKINLKGMKRKELEKLRNDVDKALEKLAEKDRKAAIAAAEKAAAAHGFSLSELSGAPAPAKRGPKPAGAKKSGGTKKTGTPKFRNPANADQTWTGKGRQPEWFKAEVAKGTPPEKMAI